MVRKADRMILMTEVEIGHTMQKGVEKAILKVIKENGHMVMEEVERDSLTMTGEEIGPHMKGTEEETEVLMETDLSGIEAMTETEVEIDRNQIDLERDSMKEIELVTVKDQETSYMRIMTRAETGMMVIEVVGIEKEAEMDIMMNLQMVVIDVAIGKIIQGQKDVVTDRTILQFLKIAIEKEVLTCRMIVKGTSPMNQASVMRDDIVAVTDKVMKTVA